jgi:hypothetical protein
MRDTLLALVRAYEDRFGPIDGAAAEGRRRRPVKLTSPVAEPRRHPQRHAVPHGIVPTATREPRRGELGSPATNSGTVEDVEVWDRRAAGAVVGHYAGRNADGKPILLVASPPNVHFQVTLVQDDGGASTQGSKTTTAGFTYKIRYLGQTQDLATGKSPAWGRWNGLRTAASSGAAYYDNGGTLQLAIAYETLGTGGC